MFFTGTRSLFSCMRNTKDFWVSRRKAGKRKKVSWAKHCPLYNVNRLHESPSL